MTVTIENTTTANGTQTDFNFTFPYLDTTDIKVSVNGADQATTKYSLLNATTIRFNDSDKPANNDVVRIYRSTSSDTPKATFYAGSVIRAGDLNDNTLQNLYITQEANVDVLNAWKTGDQTIISTEGWHTSDDTKIATTKAIEARIDTKIDNLSGEVTANSSGVTEVADGKIDLANLKVSNTGSVGQYLQKSSTTEGLTWASGSAAGGGLGIDFNDDVKARFGTGNDLEIYHNGTNSIIADVGDGNLNIQTTGNYVKIKASGEDLATFKKDNEVALFYNNSKKLETTDTGVTITGTAVADGFTGNVTGNVTGSSGSCTGNAATATTATNANHISVADNENTDENNLIPFIEDASATGNVGLESDGDFYYNPSTGVVTATAFTGNLTGNVTGNVTGTAATVTGATQSAIQSVGTLGSLTVGTGDLIVDTDTLLVDSSEDKVGINKTPTASLDVAGNVIQTSTAVAALEIDCSTGNYFTKAISTSSTFTFANVPTNGNAYGFVLEVDVTGSSTEITWPGAVKWPANTAPSLTDTKTHLFSFVTVDGGSNWRGSSAVDFVT